MNKINCWEYYSCGREPDGKNIKKSGVCSIFENKHLNGINNGKFGGRICWGVSGTLCLENIEGVIAKNIDSCMRCDFFRKVQKEETKARFKLVPPKIKLK